MPAAFRTARIVEFGDTDMAGIVHFANFFRFMEAAEHAFLRSLGLSVVMDIDGGKYGLPRVSAACDYLRPARFGDELTIKVTVVKVGRSSVNYAFEFTLDRRDDRARSGDGGVLPVRPGPSAGVGTAGRVPCETGSDRGRIVTQRPKNKIKGR